MQLSRRQMIAYAAIAAVVIALGVRYVVAPGASGSPDAGQLVLAPVETAPSAAASPSAAADVLVHVCGAVRSPGVVRLPAGARIADALDLAGGPTTRAELAGVNLAAKVADGQQVVVPERGAQPVAGGSAADPAAAAAGTAAAAGGLVNINTASLSELDTLQGVGPSTAQKIIDYRTANGGFTSVEQLKDVPGIGDAKFAALKDFVTV